MSMRFLLGILASGLPEEQYNDSDVQQKIIVPFEPTVKVLAEENNKLEIVIDGVPAKFHVGMLSVSLIIGLVFGGFIAYTCWMEKNIFLGYIRNLVIALVCRTFFSILFDGVVLLGSIHNVGGGNTLLSFEKISLNLVVALWLTLTIYIHARVQRNFNSEPTLRLYKYGVPGVAVFFAFVWIFTFQDQYPYISWWLIYNPFSQWIINSINLLFLFVQLALVADIVRMMRKTTLDNDSTSLLWKTTAMMGILVFIFWLHSGLTFGRAPLRNTSSYVYFFYFVDGLECAFVCVVLFFFNKWVMTLSNKISSIISGVEDLPAKATEPNAEVLLTGQDNRGIVTIDSLFMTHESGRWKNTDEAQSKDVVYTNVVGPERLKKTLELYKRLNIIPQQQVTLVEGEKFYDCHMQLENRKLSEELKTASGKLSEELKKYKTGKKTEQIQKRNAFYASKYLILDSKESEFPKYLETRPSVSSVSDGPKEERIDADLLSELNSLVADELVRKWLNDNSENMQKYEKNKKAGDRHSLENEDFFRKYSDSKVVNRKSVLETGINTKRLFRRQSSAPEKVSDQRNIFALIKDKRNNSDKNKKTELDLHREEIQKVQPPASAERKASDKTSGENLPIKPIPTTEEHNEKDGTPRRQSFVFTETLYSTFDSLINAGNDILRSRREFAEKKRTLETVKIEPESQLAVGNKTRNDNLEGETSTAVNKNREYLVLKSESELLLHKKQKEEAQKKEQFLSHDEKLMKDQESDTVTTTQSDKPTEATPEKYEKQEELSRTTDKQQDDKNPDSTEGGGFSKNNLSHCLTYSELLEFRSKRDKQTNNKSFSTTKNYNLTDSIFSTIDSLFNVGSSFLSSKKSLLSSEKLKTPDICDITDDGLRLESKNKRLERKNEELQSESLLLTEDTKTVSNLLQFPMRLDELTTQSVKLEDKEFLEQFHTLPNEPLTTQPDKSEFVPELEKKEYLKPTEDISNDNKVNKTKGLNQPLKEPQSDPELELGLNEEVSEEFTSKSEIQMKTYIDLINPIQEHTRSQLMAESKNYDKSNQEKNKYNLEQEESEHQKPQAPETIPEKTDQTPSNVPLSVQSVENVRTRRLPTISSNAENLNPGGNQEDVTEATSESEFSTEKKKSSTSSAESFSVDQYYASLMANKSKFNSKY